MDKDGSASIQHDILETIADMGLSEMNMRQTLLTPMEERGYYDEEGNLAY